MNTLNLILNYFKQFITHIHSLMKIFNKIQTIILRAKILETHEANPVARCCDLTWRSVVLWLLSVYVNFRVILLNKNGRIAMVDDRDITRDRIK